MAPKSQKALRSPPRKPSSNSSPNPEEIARDEHVSSKPPPSTHGNEQKASSKKRKKEQEENGNPTSTEKKKVGAKVFTNEDEIAILEGMIDCRLSIATKELRIFLEGKLSGDFSHTQLYEKIRRLKEKFVKNLKHSDSLKGHDASVFDLSNEIWAKEDNVLVDDGTDSKKKKVDDGTDSNKQKNLLKNSPMKVARDGLNGCDDSTKNKLLEEIACLVKKYEMKAELVRLDYEQMMKG